MITTTISHLSEFKGHLFTLTNLALVFAGRMHVSLDKSEVTTDRGEALKLVCQSRSEPDISIEWSKDGEPITDSRIGGDGE